MIGHKRFIEKPEKRQKYKIIILSLFMASLIITNCTGCLKKKNNDTYSSDVVETGSTSDITSSTSSVADVTPATIDTPDLVSSNYNLQVNSEDTLEINAFDFYYSDLFSRYLVYDTKTKVVYIRSSYGDFTPYLSENGNYCRYVDGKLVEIEK